MSELQPVTMELIKTLRLEGKYKAANELMDSWRANGKANSKQLKKELLRVERKKKLTLGLCGKYYCNSPVVAGKTMCSKCAQARKNYTHNVLERAKQKGVCTYCKKNEPRENLLTCSSCAERSKYNYYKRKARGAV